MTVLYREHLLKILVEKKTKSRFPQFFLGRVMVLASPLFPEFMYIYFHNLK